MKLLGPEIPEIKSGAAGRMFVGPSLYLHGSACIFIDEPPTVIHFLPNALVLVLVISAALPLPLLIRNMVCPDQPVSLTVIQPLSHHNPRRPVASALSGPTILHFTPVKTIWQFGDLSVARLHPRRQEVARRPGDLPRGLHTHQGAAWPPAGLGGL